MNLLIINHQLVLARNVCHLVEGLQMILGERLILPTPSFKANLSSYLEWGCYMFNVFLLAKLS